MGREGCSAHSGGHRRVPSSLTTDKVPSVGAHHAASVSQEAPLSFIYYLFNLVAAPTSATCYKKRSKVGLGAPPAASVRRGGKRKVLSWPPPHTGRAPAKGSGGGAGTALCPACPSSRSYGMQTKEKSQLRLYVSRCFSVMLHRAGLKVPARQRSTRPSSSARLLSC